MNNIRRYYTTRKNQKQWENRLPRFMSFNHEIQNSLKLPKLYPNINQQRQRLFTQNYSLLGNPQNPYLINRIKQLTTNVSNIKLQKFHTHESTKKMLSNPSFLITSNQQFNSIQSINKSKKKNSNTELLISKAYLINQLQKIQRLKQKRQEQQIMYQCLSQRIKCKLSPKKLKIKMLDNPMPMSKCTWYQKWTSAQQNYQKVKKEILIKRYKKLSCKNNIKNLIRGQRSCP